MSDVHVHFNLGDGSMLSDAIKAEIRSIISVVESEKEQVITVIGQKIDQAVAGSLAKIAELEAIIVDLSDQLAKGEVVDLEEIKAVVGEVKESVESIATPDVPPVDPPTEERI